MKITTVAQYLFLGNSYFLQLFLISPYGLLNCLSWRMNWASFC